MKFCHGLSRPACALTLVALAGLLLLPPPTGHAAVGPKSRANRLDEFFKKYEIVEIDPAAVAAQVRSTGRFTLETAAKTFELVLAPRELRSAGYRAEDSGDGGAKRGVTRAPSVTFAGHVANMPGVTARFSLEDDKLTGLIIAGDEWYYVERLGNYSLAGGPTDYVFYAGSDVEPDSVGVCGTSAAEKLGDAMAKMAPEPSALAGPNRVVQLATECDYEFVTALGGVTNANNDILTVMNQVEGVYQNEVGLAFEIVYQHTWSTSADPFNATAPSTMLNEFGNYWNANMSGVSRDLAHMWTGRDMDGSTIGIAWVGVVCGAATYSYGVSQRYSAAPARYILTAHEIGHNFDGDHSDGQTGCTNTIMHSSVGSGLTFCQFSRNQIINWVNTHQSCLSTVPTTTVGVYNPATSSFFLRNSNSPGTADASFSYGAPGMVPLAGDWDGNNTSTIGVYDPASATFFLRNANAPGSANWMFRFGPAGLVPIAGDWNGDKTQTVGVYNPATGTFFLRNTHAGGGADVTFSFGAANAGFVPVVGDWDGDGDDTVGVYNPATGTFFLKNSNAPGPADYAFRFGPAGARPVAGDWTGLGRDGVGVYVPATRTFFLRNTTSAGPADVTLGFGPAFLTPVVGDWNGV
jgi:hypothetical protein